MPGPIPIVSEEIARYLERFRRPRDPILARLEAEAAAESWPIVLPGTAALLEVIVRMRAPERALEIGTAIGYSGILIARSLPPWGNLDTVEIDPETARRAQANFREAGLAARVTVLQGSALDVLPRLEKRYDLVFIDGAKEEYAAYLALALPLMPKGAAVVVDNLLWGGRVATGSEPDPFFERTTPPIRSFNEAFLAHPDLVATIIPTGDGVGLGVKV